MNTKVMKMIEECNTIDDFVELYSKLEEMEELGQASSTELKYVEDRIGALAGIQGATVEKTLILKAELDRVKELIDVCESVDDFIAVKEEMNAKGYTNEVKEKALEYGGKIISERMPDKVDAYNTYLDLNPMGIKSLIGAIVCGIILAAIAIIVVPVLLSNLDIWLSILFLDLEIDAVFVRNVLLVIAVLWEIGGIGSIPSERKCKKLKPTYEEMSKLGSAGYKIRMSKK